MRAIHDKLPVERKKTCVPQQRPMYTILWISVSSYSCVERDTNDIAFAHTQLSHKTQTLVVEAVDELPGWINQIDMFQNGMILKSWLNRTLPLVEYAANKSCAIIILSIVPNEQQGRRGV